MPSFEQGPFPAETGKPVSDSAPKTPDRAQINRWKSDRKGAATKLEKGGAQRVKDSEGNEVLVPTEEQTEAIKKEHDDAVRLLAKLESPDFDQAYQKIQDEVEEYFQCRLQYDSHMPEMNQDLNRQANVLMRDLRLFFQNVELLEKRNPVDLWLIAMEMDFNGRKSGYSLLDYKKGIPSMVSRFRSDKIKELKKVLGEE